MIAKMTSRSNIPLAQPDISQAEIDAVTEVLGSGWLSCGPWVEKFESAMAEFVGCEHVVAVANGTCALHLILKSLGIGPGDEVITTPYSFVASSNCILFEGATVVFADVDRQSYNIDPKEVESRITPKTKAIIAVDVFGRLSPMKELRAIASKHGLSLIEDSCEALGTQGVGQSVTASTFGFYPNKQITCGEGGAICTNDAAVADLSQSLRNQGRSNEPGTMSFERLGYNFRLSDIACALLHTQLRRFADIQGKRNKVVDLYNQRLAATPLRLPTTWQPEGVSWFVYVVELPASVAAGTKAELIGRLASEGIGAGPYFNPIHLEPFYQQQLGFKPGDYPECEYIGERTLALPYSSLMSQDEVERVCDAVVRHLKELGV